MTAASLRLELFGEFTLARGGVALRLPVAVQRVVAFVALSDRPVGRARLAQTLWSEEHEKRGRARLRTALWELRRRGVPVLDGDDRLVLSAGVSHDVADLAGLSQRLASGTATDADLAADGVAGGELLHGWDEDWVMLERERQHQRALHVLESRTRALRERGRYGEALQSGLDAVALDPLRESAHRAVIEVYLAEGNRVEAIRQHRRCAEALRDAVGLDPGKELTRLVYGDAQPPPGGTRVNPKALVVESAPLPVDTPASFIV